MGPTTPCVTWRRYRELLLRNTALAELRREHIGSAIAYRRTTWQAVDTAFDNEADCQRALRSLGVMMDAMQVVLCDEAMVALHRARTDEDAQAARLLIAQADGWRMLARTLQALAP